jgi:hypothetical protein
MSKYAALGQFLDSQRGHQVPLSFREIEALLGFGLPKSAREFPPWWANQVNGGHSQCRAWMAKGWRTSQVDLARERLVFIRDIPREVPPGLGEAQSRFETAPPDGTPSIRSVTLDLAALSLPSRRLLSDYQAESGGTLAQAVARAIHEAAIARRVRRIDAIAPARASARAEDGTGSVEMIREDRDAR